MKYIQYVNSKKSLVLAEHNTSVTYERHKLAWTENKYLALIITYILRDW